MNAGDHCRVLALLHNVDAPGCAMMRARALVRLLEFDRALTECKKSTYNGRDPHENVQLLEMQMGALFALGDNSGAWDAFELQQIVARKSGERILAAYSLQTEFWLACRTEDNNRALSALAATRSKLKGVSNGAPRKFYHVDSVALRARVSNIEGWLYNFIGENKSQEVCFLAAASDSAAHTDRWFEAGLLVNVAGLMIESRSLVLYEYVAKRFQTFPWTAHTDECQSVLKTALRNGERLYGFKCPDGVKARTAPTLSTRFAMAQAGLLYDEWNDHRAFIEECRFCVSMILDINNIEAAGIEIGVILNFAAVLAPLDRALAHRVRDIYRQRREHVPRFYGPTHRALFEARIRIVDACLAKADDDLPRALALYNEAFDFIGMSTDGPIASITGLERFSVSRNPADLEYARKFIADNPRTRFSRRLAAALEAAETAEPNGFPYLGLYAPHGPNPAPLRAADPTAVSSA